MGTTLTNGIYLPNEGEKNCYAGLKTNWETLDQKIADITALQQAVAGALHREIVESLPTTDIDPNTIYMVLSGTSATENVYDEFMYVNNAWELIGTSATDLTNYYTKGEVDGLLLLKANASDLTSHTGDTTIHVTASDKTKWTNSANTVVLRLAKTALTPSSSTNAFSNLDDSTALKVGDKVMDTTGVLFEVTAIDTANSTFSIGTALIDLAQDSDVVHKSGEESIIGNKRFGVVQSFTGYPTIRLYSTIDDINVLPPYPQQQDIRFTDKNNNIIAYFIFQHRTDANEPFRTCWRQNRLDGTDGYYSVNFNNLGEFYPENNNGINLGRNGNRWKSVYATNYYYGSNNVEFSTKFVTTDTNQTISGGKTFSSPIRIYNASASVQTDVPNLVFKNPLVERASTTLDGEQTILFTDKNDNNIASIQAKTYTSGMSDIILTSYSEYNNDVKTTGIVIRRTPTTSKFHGFSDNITSLGDTNRRWKSVYATNYYYGSNNVEFSDKFVTTDTEQTVDGKKQLNAYLTLNGSQMNDEFSNNARTCAYLTANRDTVGKSGVFVSKFRQNRAQGAMSGTDVVQVCFDVFENEVRTNRLWYLNWLDWNNDVPETVEIRSMCNKVDYKLTHINGLNPSSLGMPDLSNGVDISSYITHLDKVVNSYTPPVNGYVHIRVKKTSLSIVSIRMQQLYGLMTSCETSDFSTWGAYLPVVAGNTVEIYISADSLGSAIFFPCQGNI